jgi:hypothetical protein
VHNFFGLIVFGGLLTNDTLASSLKVAPNINKSTANEISKPETVRTIVPYRISQPDCPWADLSNPWGLSGYAEW